MLLINACSRGLDKLKKSKKGKPLLYKGPLMVFTVVIYVSANQLIFFPTPPWSKCCPNLSISCLIQFDVTPADVKLIKLHQLRNLVNFI